jgi:hypothetical protein
MLKLTRLMIHRNELLTIEQFYLRLFVEYADYVNYAAMIRVFYLKRHYEMITMN